MLEAPEPGKYNMSRLVTRVRYLRYLIVAPGVTFR